MTEPVPHTSRTHPGLRREGNEDVVLTDAAHGLYLVADGVGGQAAGERAAALTATTFVEAARPLGALVAAYGAQRTKESRLAVLEALEQVSNRASQRVFEMGEAEDIRGTSTTLVAVLVGEGAAFLAHVGDSRAYLLREGTLHQLTEDHSLVNEMMRRGELTAREAATSRHRNVITRAVGALPSVQPDVLSLEILPGDRLLLCSDGLSDPVGHDHIARHLALPSPEQASDALLQAALAAGGPDNISVVVLDPPPAPGAQQVAARARVLASLYLFQDFPLSARMRVSRMVREVFITPGEVLIEQGQPGLTMYTVVEGALVVSRDGVELARLGVGETFGELSLVDARPRSARVTATEFGSVIAIDRAELVRFCQREPELGNRVLWRLLESLTMRLRDTSDRLAGGHPGGPTRKGTPPVSQTVDPENP